MELNKKILKIGLLLIILSLIFTMGFALAYRLENPVFLKMYVEQYISSNDMNIVDGFELKYITNVSDNRKVIDIDFEEEPNIKVDVSYWPIGGGGFSFFNDNNYDEQRGDRYGRYAVHTIYLDMNLHDIDKEFYEIELNNVKVSFDDGSILDTDLGRVIIYKDKNEYKDIEHLSSSGSSDGTSASHQRTKRDIKLLNINSPLLKELKEYFDISIGDIDYRHISGIEYEKDKSLNIYTKFEPPNDIVGKYTFYNIKPKLYYEDEEGNTSYIRIHNINYKSHNFDLKGIFKYLKARGEI